MNSQLITCTKCNEAKLFTMFYCDRRKANGRKSWCRKCIGAYNSKKAKAKRRLKATYGIVTTYKGKRYTAVFVAPFGFTDEAVYQAVNR